MFYPFVAISTPNTFVIMINKEDVFHRLRQIQEHIDQGFTAENGHKNFLDNTLIQELLLGLHNAPKELEEDFLEVLRKHDIPAMVDDPNLQAFLRSHNGY